MCAVFVMCTADDSVRLRIMAMISDLGMDTNEYVYIFADTRSKGFSSLQVKSRARTVVL